MKRVFLYGFYGIENAGNEAMLRALIEPIRSHFSGDIEFVVSNRHPTDAYDQRYGVRSFRNLEFPHRDAARGKWLRGLNPDDSPEFLALLHEIAESDLVILGPGQYLVETGELGLLKGSLAQFSAVVLLCQLTKTPCYGLALACEPLSSPWSILTIQEVLPALASITFRDPQSIENLRSVGIEIPEYELLGDLALAGKAASEDLGRALMKREGVPEKKGSRLAVAMRSIYWLGLDQDEIRSRIARALEIWLEHDPNADILMIPQNVYHVDGDRDDDRVANALVAEKISEHLRERVYEIKGGDLDPAEVESLYGHCDVTLAGRLHGSVFSCKQGTPPVVFSFMDKAKGFFARIEHQQCLVPLEMSSEDLAGKMLAFQNQRETLSKSIKDAVARVHETARRYPQVAIELLEKPLSERRKWISSVLKK